MTFNSKTLQNSDFVLYDLNDQVICYFQNFNELSKYINYKVYDLAYKFKEHGSNIIKIIIENKEYKLAFFC